MPSKAKHIRAAEAALGLEPVGLETKPEAALRQKWERHLAPLGLALQEQQPPPDLWYRVEASLHRAEDKKTIKRVKRSAWGWRFATLGATAVAAALAAFIVLKPAERTVAPATPSPTRHVAVVTPEGSTEAMIVEVDLEAGTAIVRPVGVNAVADKSLEMWRIAPGAAPVSVGLVPPGGITTLDLSADVGDTIAISLEPTGGSTTGAPTGPVVYSGALIAVPE